MTDTPVSDCGIRDAAQPTFEFIAKLRDWAKAPPSDLATVADLLLVQCIGFLTAERERADRAEAALWEMVNSADVRFDLPTLRRARAALSRATGDA